MGRVHRSEGPVKCLDRTGAERHRNQQSDHGHGDGGPATTAQLPEVDLVPGHEHEDHDGDLGEHAEDRQHLVGKQLMGEIPGQPTEQGRPQSNSSNDLTDHRGLPAAPGQGSGQPGDHHDQRNITNDQRGQ